jgi:hypothetical protein
MTRSFRAALAACALVAAPLLAADPYGLKVVEKSEPPKELDEKVRKELKTSSVQFTDDKGKVLAEVWLRKEVPSAATEAQVQNGLTWQEVPQSTLIGAIKIDDGVTDYRKQKIRAGVFTLRLGYQPMDGDHMGTAPNNEFVILVPAKNDAGEASFEVEKLHKLSTRASNTGHPAVLLLFPVAKKDLGKPPSLSKRDGDHWVVTLTQDVTAKGKKTTIGIALTLVGVSPSA